jgi:uncharacterized protein, PH0010 family
LPTDDRGATLLRLARTAIARNLGFPAEADDSATWLREPGATFVTLTRDGQLRGCIGSLEACRTLAQDVQSNACAAAFRDPRFPPLCRDEFGNTCIEVSLLSPLEPIPFRDEQDALAQLRPHVDGVVLEHGYHRGTFLPQVWEQLPTPEQFLSQLKRKAGLPPDFWDDGIKLYRYTVEKWKES